MKYNNSLTLDYHCMTSSRISHGNIIHQDCMQLTKFAYSISCNKPNDFSEDNHGLQIGPRYKTSTWPIHLNMYINRAKCTNDNKGLI